MSLLKDHLEYSQIEVSELSKRSGVSCDSIFDLVNEKIESNKMKIEKAKLLADALGYSLDQFYLLCTDKEYVFYKNLYGRISFVNGNPKIDMFNLKDEKVGEEKLPDLKEYTDLFLNSLGRYTLEKKYKENQEKELVKKLHDSNWEV